jgi:molybdopterin molybdotransferase
MKSLDEIAAQLQGYDPQALSAAGVNDFLAKLVEPVTAALQVGIFDALGRVTAQDIISPVSVPPHDNSAMDGFAFDGAQLQAGDCGHCARGQGLAGQRRAGAMRKDHDGRDHARWARHGRATGIHETGR